MSPWCCRMFDELIGTDGCFVLCYGCFLFFLVVRRPPRSTLFPSRRSSDLPPQRRRRGTVIDETRRSFQLDLAGLSIPKSALMTGDKARAALTAVRDAALLLTSAEAAGGLAGVLQVILEYLNTRSAFGRKIGSY